MGTWGTGIFQDDDASDFAGAPADDPQGAPALLRGRLKKARRPRLFKLGAGAAAEALAAAAVISVARGGSPLDAEPTAAGDLDAFRAEVLAVREHLAR
jgi:hypothetical protein